MTVKDIINELRAYDDDFAEVLLDVGETRLRLITQVRLHKGKIVLEMGGPV